MLAFPASASAAGLETIIQDDRLFLHQPKESVAQSMADVRALGADTVRLTANWSSLAPAADQKTKPPGIDLSDPASYETARWQRLDDAVRLATAQGLRVAIDIGFWAPLWATADEKGPRAKTAVNPQDYAEFTVALVRRYSGTFAPPPPVGPAPPPSEDEQELDRVLGSVPPPPGVTRAPQERASEEPAPSPLPKVSHFTLWNEPNHHALLMPQWTPDGKTASPAIYRAMVMAAYPAAKGVRPDTKILIGNTSSSGGATAGGSGPVAPLRFLRDVACVDENLRPRSDGDCAGFTTLPGDGWAHHPYARNMPPDATNRGRRSDDVLVGDLPRMALTLDALAASGRIGEAVREIHVTEFGYETEALGPDRPGVPQDRHAQWIVWGERMAGKVPTVKAWAQFLLRDQPPAAERVSESLRRPFGQFWTGLYGSEGQEKLAVQSFKAGLVAERAGRKGVTLWGRLRLGDGARRLFIERSVLGRPWRRLTTNTPQGGRLEGSFLADGRESFARGARYVRGARYRLVVSGMPAGLPVDVVGKAPKAKAKKRSAAKRRAAKRRS
ncbi:MAG: hypothetical protein AVDCRST_MAG85-4359 [uncultured Solirubrobacteraceae bacterium]|uniref:Glycoside hydrolase family 5 domain-containing protein n=1 Tax=uncultured Solirubrobacteraceae bacterium TaxID=1162706 RepID=A0A6J4U287_9ACTN|nr:MAG: hypothetical protein AVDCRST_MAG85-4359 [uncultured Solirubrobacteraceae bacterium]